MLMPVPVLGLERAVVLVQDQRDQLLHERLVALEVLGLGEVRGQHEVQVPGRGVARDPREEAVLAQQRLDVAGRLGDPLGRHADVLDDQGGARRAQAADQPVQPLAHRPGDLDPLAVAGEVGRADQLAAREDRARPSRPARPARPRSRPRTRPAAPPTRAAAPSTPSARPAMFWLATISAGATISSTALAPGGDEFRHRLGRRLDAVEVEPARSWSCGAAGHGLEAPPRRRTRASPR